MVTVELNGNATTLLERTGRITEHRSDVSIKILAVGEYLWKCQEYLF